MAARVNAFGHTASVIKLYHTQDTQNKGRGVQNLSPRALRRWEPPRTALA